MAIMRRTHRPKFLRQPMSHCYNGYIVNNNNTRATIYCTRCMFSFSQPCYFEQKEFGDMESFSLPDYLGHSEPDNTQVPAPTNLFVTFLLILGMLFFDI